MYRPGLIRVVEREDPRGDCVEEGGFGRRQASGAANGGGFRNTAPPLQHSTDSARLLLVHSGAGDPNRIEKMPLQFPQQPSVDMIDIEAGCECGELGGRGHCCTLVVAGRSASRLP